jgi:hypothetical protein
MQKKIITLFLLLLLPSCSYDAIYSKKNSMNYNFSISELNFIGNNNINLRMKRILNNYTLNRKNKDFKIKITSSSTKTVVVKDTTGDATSFKNTVAINVELLKNNKLKNNFVMAESFNYNNNSDKFSLKRYEKEIQNNLAETISEKLIFKLANIQ